MILLLIPYKTIHIIVQYLLAIKTGLEHTQPYREPKLMHNCEVAVPDTARVDPAAATTDTTRTILRIRSRLPTTTLQIQNQLVTIQVHQEIKKVIKNKHYTIVLDNTILKQ